MLHIMVHRNRLPVRLIALGLLLLTGYAGAAAQVPTSSLSAFIDSEAEARNLSGTILVERRGEILYRRSFGMADRAFDVPTTDDTRYRIASITKLFTAVLVLQLVEEGRIDLERPIRQWLPGFPGEGGGRITVHHLLNHSSGLAQYDRVASLEQALTEGLAPYQRPMSADQLLRQCCSGALARPPGSAFDYNNADYLLLGRLIEHVTGLSYEQALAQRIVDPLGLRDTGMAHQDRIISRLAPTYFWRDDRQALMNDLPVYFQNWDAAGGMYSTAEDLRRFAAALFGGRVLRPETLARMLSPGLDDYGYGLWSYDFEQGGHRHRVAKRPGSIMGANTVLYRLVDQPATVVILANTNRADLDALAQAIGARLAESNPPASLSVDAERAGAPMTR